KGRETALVAWTTGPAKRVPIAASPMNFAVYNTQGQELGQVGAQNFVLDIVMAQEPGIYVPQSPNPLLQIAALAETLPNTIEVRGPQILELTCVFVNPLPEPLILNPPGKPSVALKPGMSYTVKREVNVGRPYEPMRVEVGASGIMQTVTINVKNPLMLDLKADLPGRLTVEILNPSGDPVQGRMALELSGQAEAPFEFPVTLAKGETIKELQIPLGSALPLPAAVRLVLRASVGNPRREIELASTPGMQFYPVAPFNAAANGSPANWTLTKEGPSFAELRAANPPGGAPWPESGTLILAYKFDQPGATLAVNPSGSAAANVVDKPVSVGVWINGDGSGNLASMRWRDASGKVFETDPKPVTWQGWRYVSFSLDSAMKAPIRWENLLRLTAVNAQPGAIMASGPVFTYNFAAQTDTGDETSVKVKDEVSVGNPVRLDRQQVEQGTVPLEFVPAQPGG
ncbi:MAG: hypothetical protein ACQKBV_11235, partial [Puniceicoccales bacterium]